jgi:ubiquinone/menaquinone biosynthesis C-methylase UbiE
MTRIKPDIQIIKRGDLCYLADTKNRLTRFTPWLGDSVSFLYDIIMSRSIFPRKFGGDIQKHYDTLTQALSDVQERRVLELGTGSGSAVHFLNQDNQYTGVDVSPGLLKQAAKSFARAGFQDPEFYVVSADDLPFETGCFDVCLCILSLNFIGNVERVLQEIHRVLLPKGQFVCSVPVPERNQLRSRIRGILYSEKELNEICQCYGFLFKPIACENGILLYFRATKRE